MTSTIAAAREPGYITDPRTYRNRLRRLEVVPCYIHDGNGCSELGHDWRSQLACCVEL